MPLRRIRSTCWQALALAALLGLGVRPAAAADGEHPDWKRSGSILQFALPLAGFGLTYVLEPLADPVAGDAATSAGGLNWPGPRLGRSPRRDFLISFVRSEITTEALKYVVNRRRPDGDDCSFPSGHTSSAFVGAEFIRKQFGPAWGAPAYVAASWVGYTRVVAHRHYWSDVLAGAAIGIAANHDLDIGAGRLGTLQLHPDLLGTDAADLPDPFDTGRPSTAAASLADTVPGLRLELRFRP